MGVEETSIFPWILQHPNTEAAAKWNLLIQFIDFIRREKKQPDNLESRLTVRDLEDSDNKSIK